MEKLNEKNYWKGAAAAFKSTKLIVFAALIIALRVIVKAFKIPLASGLFLTFDCYINALGSFVYGPLMALAVGAISDTIGALLFPSGAYFLPFIFVEMASSFIFALFFWQKKITPARAITAKFTVNFICNIILTSIFTAWYHIWFGDGVAYNLINLVRIAKSLVLFPVEAILICILLNALIPALKTLKLPITGEKQKITAKHIILIAVLLIISIALILFYIFFLKDFISANNIKLL